MTTGSGDRVDLVGIIVVCMELPAFAGTCGSHTAKILFSCAFYLIALLQSSFEFRSYACYKRCYTGNNCSIIIIRRAHRRTSVY